VAGLQTGMPMTALSVLGGQFRLKAQTRAELYQDFLPWALRAGFRSADLICLYYEKHFEVGQLAHC
jgi:ubiquinone biosynthesis protein COQ4